MCKMFPHTNLRSSQTCAQGNGHPKMMTHMNAAAIKDRIMLIISQ